MAKQANRMMIGGFVVIAMILLAVSMVVFGSGRFFKKTNEYVLYFDGSIKGLNVGAPVLFQGVPVGSVSDISLRADIRKMNVFIPVIIEIEPDRFISETGHVQTEEEVRENLAKLIDMGLRGMLGMQSLITGQLIIEVDFYPGTPVELKNILKDRLEIPTIASTAERLTQSLEKLDLEGIENNLENTLAGVARLVNDPDLKAGIIELKGVMTDMRVLVKNLDARSSPAVEELDATLRNINNLVKNLDGQVITLADNVNGTVSDFGRLARDMNTRLESLVNNVDKTLSATKGVMSEDAQLVVQMENTLREVARSANSLRQLAETLERNPEALIRGKGESGGR